MAGEWALEKIGNLLEITSSKRIFRADYCESGVPFYRGKEIIELSRGNNISTELFISTEKFEEIKVKFGAPKTGDILLTSVGTLGAAYMVKDGDEFYFKDGNLTWFRNFSEKLLPRFLLLWFRSPTAKRAIDEITIGSTQQALTIVSLKSLELSLPPLDEQKRIVHILGSLDDKIELNRQMNATLEAMAQALFKSWFVDFDPVIDNALAAGNLIPEALHNRAETRKALGDLPAPRPGVFFVYAIQCENDSIYIGQTDDLQRRWKEHCGGRGASWTKKQKPIKIVHFEEFASREEAVLREKELKTTSGRRWLKAEIQNGRARQAGKRKPLPEEIQKQFPSSFVFSEEMGWIPEGWGETTFGKVSTCFDSKRVPLSKKQREEKKPGTIPYYGATSIMDYIDEWIFDDIYLLIGEDGSVIKEDGTPFVQYIWGKNWVNNHAHVLQGSSGISTEHLMLFMSCQNMSAYVTGAVQLKINQKNMNSIPFLKASDSLNELFASLIDPYYKKIRLLSEESASLTKMRDTLLPKLLSGQLRIPDAEKLVADAV